jgi:hypothetical protein
MLRAVNTRDDWPFGAELRRHREARGLSVKAAARRAKGVSDGRWYQLEKGYQQLAGQRIPIGTTPATVVAVAKAIEWDVNEALGVAGFDPIDVPDEKPSPLAAIPDEELAAEFLRRMRGARSGLESTTQSDASSQAHEVEEALEDESERDGLRELEAGVADFAVSVKDANHGEQRGL